MTKKRDTSNSTKATNLLVGKSKKPMGKKTIDKKRKILDKSEGPGIVSCSTTPAQVDKPTRGPGIASNKRRIQKVRKALARKDRIKILRK